MPHVQDTWIAYCIPDPAHQNETQAAIIRVLSDSSYPGELLTLRFLIRDGNEIRFPMLPLEALSLVDEMKEVGDSFSRSMSFSTSAGGMLSFDRIVRSEGHHQSLQYAFNGSVHIGPYKYYFSISQEEFLYMLSGIAQKFEAREFEVFPLTS